MIKLKDVNYKYKEGNDGLKNINLEFSKGEINAIIGENGCGKSTLLSCIAGLNKYHGLITLDGLDIKKIKNIDLRKKIGIVFQNPNNQIVFNKVYDELKFTLTNLGENDIDNRIKKSLDMVSMSSFIEANPYNLSMGQKQRINLANVLTTDKDFLLLDEVTSMIDNNGKQEIYKIILDLKKNNKGIIMCTNQIEELTLADKIVILNKEHQIKGIYTKEEIFTNFDYLKDFEIPLKFQLIQKIGYHNLKDLSDKEILKHVSK